MKVKLKQQPEEKKRPRNILPEAEQPSQGESIELLNQWRESVERLQGVTFSTINEAIEAIVTEVLQSRGTPDDQEAKELLHLLFESDPYLCDTIERLLVRLDRP